MCKIKIFDIQELERVNCLYLEVKGNYEDLRASEADLRKRWESLEAESKVQVTFIEIKVIVIYSLYKNTPQGLNWLGLFRMKKLSIK